MSSASQRLRQVFERRFAVALAVLIGTATVSFATSYRVTMNETDRAAALSLVYGQQANSQRVAFLINGLDATRDPIHADELRQEMLTTLHRMRAAHETLQGNGPDGASLARFTEPLLPIFFGGYAPFDHDVRTFLENAEAVSLTQPGTDPWKADAVRRSEIIAAALDNLPQTHGLMAMILEAEATRANRFSKMIDLCLWLSLLGILGLLTAVVMRPMGNWIVAAFEDLEGAKLKANRAEEQARVANAAKGNFIQVASHELKTPLNAILGLTEVLRARPELAGKMELEQMSAAGDHLLTLLNNILDTQKLVEGRLELVRGEAPLTETLTRPTRVAEALAAAKGIGFHSEIDIPENLVVNADAGRLEQVVTNLLDNAIRATSAGTVSFEAKLGPPQITRSLNLVVSDSGDGLSEQQLRHIFDRYSVSGPMDRGSAGLGLGLAVAREIVELMGGEISADSTPGKGARFVVNLPIDITNPDCLADATTLDEIASEAGLQTRKSVFDVLVIDDNMANRMVAEALLKPLGARVVTAVDGRQGVDKAEGHAFDLILMDISMPVLDGIQATQMIRVGTGPNKATPIIAFTAHVDPDELSRLRASGFQDLITKPVRKDMMARCVERWVGAREQSATEAA